MFRLPEAQLGQEVFGRGMLQLGAPNRGGTKIKTRAVVAGAAQGGDLTALLRACLVALRITAWSTTTST
jgi:hypothetical protein